MSHEPLIVLNGRALVNAALALKPHLGAADAKRLDIIVPLFKSDRLAVADCLKALFPDHSTQDALARFRQFRRTLARAAKKNDVQFVLVVDSKKRTNINLRECWFEGTDSTTGEIERLTDASVRLPSGKTILRQQGIVKSIPPEPPSTKRLINLFVSYAQKDDLKVTDLLGRLDSHFKISKKYRYKVWRDQESIGFGTEWMTELESGLAQADFGLFMLSPAALASDVITTKELPVFIGTETLSGKPFIPICVKKVDRGRCEMHGVQEVQMFRLTKRTGKKCYAELKGNDLDEFALLLFQSIEARLDDGFKGKPPTKTVPLRPPPQVDPGPTERRSYEKENDRFSEALLRTSECHHYIRAKGMVASLKHGPGTNQEEKGEDAVAYLEKWVTAKDESPFCAVLGEYGIGKTTTLQFFCRNLLKKRKSAKQIPLPIYLDLRLYQGKLDPIPTLEQILDEIIERSWKQKGRSALRADGIVRAVQQQGALIVFDGLDEKIVHLDPAGARAFIRELWRALPPGVADEAKEKGVASVGKMIISCRSHYFRDVVSQNAMLTGESRDGIDSEKHYRALFLLPFTDEQIREYLAGLPGLERREDDVMELIGSIHNLRDLAIRPYLLSIISGQIGELEKLRASGKTVQAIDLYDRIVHEWLARDDGKHQIGAPHKRLLMEHLAAAMWRDGARLWEADKLESWLDEFLAVTPAIEKAYANKSREILKEDLRTSTFVLRPDQEEKSFRFAHTSMQEYFLACHLATSLRQGRPNDWNIPRPSKETFDFVGQLLRKEKDDRCLKALASLLETNRPQATRNAFHYWLLAGEKDHPRPASVSPDLQGENLEGIDICGTDNTRPLMLGGINLAGAWIARAKFENVNMTNAKLAKCQAPQACFFNVMADGADARGANFTATVWRDCSVDNMNLNDAKLKGSEWIRPSSLNPPLAESNAIICGTDKICQDPNSCSLFLSFGCSAEASSVVWSPDGSNIVSVHANNTLKVWDATSGKPIQTLKGYGFSTSVLSRSPDGLKIVTGSWDNSLRVWDTKTGHPLLDLKGHNDSVFAAAWSPDGSRIVSGARDNSLRVWDSTSGKPLCVINGLKSSVLAVSWSPDGTRIVAGYWDHSLRIWDARTGRRLLDLSGHIGSIRTVSWSPDGTRIVSGSADNSLRVWHASSGKTLLLLQGHRDLISVAVWSADNSRIFSGSADNTLKAWDAQTGKSLLSFEGHMGSIRVVSCSPDGSRIVSGSADNSLRVWDASSGKALLVLQGRNDSISSAAWSPDYSRIVTGSTDNIIRVWDASSGKHLLTLPGHTARISAVAWSPDSSKIISGSWDKTVRIWDLFSGKSLLVFEEHGDCVSSTAWSPDGARILSGSWANPIRVWDARSAETSLTLDGHFEPVNTAVWSPDGTRIASGSDDENDNNLTVHDARSGKIFNFKGHKGHIYTVSWSPDGTRIVSGSSDNTLKVWASASGKSLLTLKGHRGPVCAVAWSPDGSRIVSGSSDCSLRVWDAKTGRLLLEVEGHLDPVHVVTWSPDGKRLLSGSEDNTLRVWDATTGKEISTLLLVGEDESALFNITENRILAASPNAWRSLAWRKHDKMTGEVTILPAECFGPLPLVPQ